MNLEQHYDQLYLNAVQKIKNSQNVKDPWIDNPKDNRYGITLLARPDHSCNQAIQAFLEEIKTLEPSQYYYPASDIHLTIMSLISCYPGFSLENVNAEDYVDQVSKSLRGMSPFSIKLKGITASPSCIMVQGFPENGLLNNIRDQLRNNFKKGKLEHTIDKRYILQTAHNTIVRFRKPFQNKEDFLELLHQYRNFDFGTFRVNSLELVFNDWYQRKSKVQTLHHFTLNKTQRVI